MDILKKKTALQRSNGQSIHNLLLYCIFSISLGICETYISSSKLSNEVTIDGKWTKTGEWDDAEKIKVYGRSHIKFHKTLIGLFLIKDDNEFLYVMIDYVGDKTLEKAHLRGKIYVRAAVRPPPGSIPGSLFLDQLH